MSAVRAMASGASSAAIYAGTQAGYNLAIADLTAAGGVIEVSGLDSLVLGTVPSNIVVMWFKVSGGLDITGTAFTLSNASPIRFKKLDGTTSDVVNLGGGNNDVVIAAPASSNLVLRSNAGVYEINMSETGLLDMRFLTGLGLSGGAAGTSGQVPVAAAPGSMPVWTSITGVGNSTTKNTFYPAPMWQTNALGTVLVGSTNQEWNGLSVFIAGSDRKAATQIVVPRDFNALVNWELWWTSNGTNATNVTWVFGKAKLTNGATSVGSYTNSNNVVTPPGTADQTVVTTLTDNAVAMAAGDVFKVRLERDGTADANPDTMRLIGLKLIYT